MNIASYIYLTKILNSTRSPVIFDSCYLLDNQVRVYFKKKIVEQFICLQNTSELSRNSWAGHLDARLHFSLVSQQVTAYMLFLVSQQE